MHGASCASDDATSIWFESDASDGAIFVNVLTSAATQPMPLPV